MPAPSKLVLRVSSRKFSAFILSMDLIEPHSDINCKACSPIKSKMVYQAYVGIPGKEFDQQYAIYECKRCGRQWAVHREVPAGGGESA